MGKGDRTLAQMELVFWLVGGLSCGGGGGGETKH